MSSSYVDVADVNIVSGNYTDIDFIHKDGDSGDCVAVMVLMMDTIIDGRKLMLAST